MSSLRCAPPKAEKQKKNPARVKAARAHWSTLGPEERIEHSIHAQVSLVRAGVRSRIVITGAAGLDPDFEEMGF